MRFNGLFRELFDRLADTGRGTGVATVPMFIPTGIGPSNDDGVKFFPLAATHVRDNCVFGQHSDIVDAMWWQSGNGLRGRKRPHVRFEWVQAAGIVKLFAYKIPASAFVQRHYEDSRSGPCGELTRYDWSRDLLRACNNHRELERA